MKVQKAGCILVNLETKEIGLVYRLKKDDYSFPKGHLESGETLEECAIRETEEETGRICHIVKNIEIEPIEYVTPKGEDVINYHYVAIDDGKTKKEFVKAIKDEAKDTVGKNLEKMKIANKTWTGLAAAAALGLAGMGIAMMNKKDA